MLNNTFKFFSVYKSNLIKQLIITIYNILMSIYILMSHKEPHFGFITKLK
jgi:hypothetical protein